MMSNMPVDSLASAIDEYEIIKEENRNTGIKKDKFNLLDNMKNIIFKIIEPKEEKKIIKINRNIVEGSVLEISLADGEFVPDLIGNPNGYETIRVTTIGSKKLVKADYDNLRESGIPKVDLSNSNSDSIPPGAFTNATHLTEFKFPKGILSIDTIGESGAFSGCINLSGELSIPNSVRNIGAFTFDGCINLTGNLIIPESVVFIGSYAFRNCTGFTGDLIIPNSVSSMGNGIFEGCTGFDGTLKISNSIRIIPINTFAKCKRLRGDLVIPNSVTTIQGSAFKDCVGFNGNLIIPNSVENIGSSAFQNCNGFVGDLILPNSIKEIKAFTFENCSGFNGRLIIPNSVTLIDSYAFQNCSGFTGDLIIPDSVITISSYSFINCSGFNGKLVISNSITNLGAGSFKNCSGLTGELKIPNSLNVISTGAFQNCAGFTGVLKIPNTVTNIGTNAFSGCKGFVGDLIIPDSVLDLGGGSFAGCKGFNGIVKLPKYITSFENYTFNGCTGLTGNLIIPDSVTYIGSQAIVGIPNINKIIIGINECDSITNYKKDIIDSLPFDSRIIIDIPYNLNIKDTWLETTSRFIGRPILKEVINKVEHDLVSGVGEIVSISITSPYTESNITLLKDGENFNLPKKDINNKYIFTELGEYVITVITDCGNISNIKFVVSDKNIEQALEQAETSGNYIDIQNARDLVNQLPECAFKNQFQNRLNNISTNITLEKKSATSNLDVYIKCENILQMTLDTNSITFEDFSGVEDLEKTNAVNLTINSSLPYQLNAYLPVEIQNSDKSNTMDKDILNIKENSETTYQTFSNTTDKIILKDNCPAGNDRMHGVDIKLGGGIAHEKDVYKTTIKFEAEQK